MRGYGEAGGARRTELHAGLMARDGGDVVWQRHTGVGLGSCARRLGEPGGDGYHAFERDERDAARSDAADGAAVLMSGSATSSDLRSNLSRSKLSF